MHLIQLHKVPNTVRKALDLQWGRDRGKLLGLKRIIIDDWCGFLQYKQVCPYSPRREQKCHPRCIEQLDYVAKETGTRGLGYFRRVLQGQRAIHHEEILAAMSGAAKPPEPVQGSTKDIVEGILRELNA